MRSAIRNGRNLVIGLIYIAFGLGFLLLSRAYPMGTLAKMGPGYLPAVLSLVLIAVGAASVALSLTGPAEAVARLNLRAAAFVVAAVAGFAFLLERAGLVIALAVLLGVSGGASRESRLDLPTLAASAIIIALCVLVFVVGLGLPMPLIGRWFR
ncbi:tripartite tricarboxylate transporter TctB family protein [Xanthobacter sp. V0B-10]|uniref:tripartite tricarboxylate transporter TctB family protein n=1 Tax=Xanthobacter albus TaxID=3119929 RepID=UPI0037285F80